MDRPKQHGDAWDSAIRAGVTMDRPKQHGDAWDCPVAKRAERLLPLRSCDGIDGDVARGIFVSLVGDDSAACGLTYTSPCATIGYGIARGLPMSTASSTRAVLVVPAPLDASQHRPRAAVVVAGQAAGGNDRGTLPRR